MGWSCLDTNEQCPVKFDPVLQTKRVTLVPSLSRLACRGLLCVNIYVHTFTHSPFTAGVDVDCVARVSDPSMVDVAKIGCFWRVEKRL